MILLWKRKLIYEGAFPWRALADRQTDRYGRFLRYPVEIYTWRVTNPNPCNAFLCKHKSALHLPFWPFGPKRQDGKKYHILRYSWTMVNFFEIGPKMIKPKREAHIWARGGDFGYFCVIEWPNSNIFQWDLFYMISTLELHDHISKFQPSSC